MKGKLMRISLKYTLVLALLLFVVSCGDRAERVEQFERRVEKIRHQYAPDPSVSILKVNLEQAGKKWAVAGETTVPAAKSRLMAAADSIFGAGQVQDKLMLLPDPQLGDSTYGIISVPVAHLREEPRHAAQLLDQAVMGRTVRLLKRTGGWYLVQTRYGYLGWMRRESFHRSDRVGIARWEKEPKVEVRRVFAFVYSRPDENSEPVCDGVMNMLLKREKTTGQWYRVSTPDGRRGFIRRRSVTPRIDARPPAGELRRSILKFARMMMGIPYLWGGNSSLMNDCSGFTQTVFKANGIQLPRDARQQAMLGQEIVPDSAFSNLLPGDLLFFGSGEKVTHVGISLGGDEYIHQSGEVHINSFNPKAPNYSPYRRKSLMKVTRIIPTQDIK